MFVEGTLRWQVTEDCPWDLLMALCLRDLGGLADVGDPVLPAVIPAVQRRGETTGTGPRTRTNPATITDPDALKSQWNGWWQRTLIRETRPLNTQLRPPHFTVFDRELELQDLVEDYYEDAIAWTAARHEEYTMAAVEHHATRSADIVDVVREREHVLRRQAGYFRLDLYVLPLATAGAWIVAPHTVVVSQRLRDDSVGFRRWFTPVVSALV